jgi:hypothetical protein
MRRFTLIPLIIAVVSALGRLAVADQPVANPIIEISAPVDPQAAVREIATVAVQRASARLGAPGGIYRVPRFHIPLPAELDKPVKVLEKAYAQRLPDAVEMAINRAAEASAPATGNAILQALPHVTFTDPDRVLHGPDDAVTRQIEAQLGPSLHDAVSAAAQANLRSADAIGATQRMRAKYEQMTDSPFPAFDITAYTSDQLLHTFFAAVAEEERSIRNQPSARSTPLLNEIFPVQ